MEKIAICITTHNRKNVFEKSLQNWIKYLPTNATIFVVDDASVITVNSNYRFEKNVGIAKAKNKCLELAEDFDHIFLVDDDVFPKVFGWEKPYINSNINHLCLTFEKNYLNRYYSPSIRLESTEDNINYYTAPNGCMLYLTKECIKKAGGMRPEFGLWGFEHVEYSYRIHAVGLTKKPFGDVKNSLDLFEVLDWKNQVKSSLSVNEKRTSGKNNFEIYKKFNGLKDFVNYK
jgi:glycosyltransferase involved in cell wall biosynthesis